MIDPDSAVNLMPYRTLKRIGYTTNDLEFESVVIQGFNLNDQSAMGSIRLTIQVGKLLTKAKLKPWIHQYKMVLGRPWIHQYKMVLSTLH